MRLAGPILSIAAVLLVAAACADGDAGNETEGLDRETFVAAYVDLRRTALEQDTDTISEADRASVLARHGVSEGDLLRFAERHGDDAGFMRQIWDEVELRLEEALEEPADTLAP